VTARAAASAAPDAIVNIERRQGSAFVILLNPLIRRRAEAAPVYRSDAYRPTPRGAIRILRRAAYSRR
jgi:hypothetical protein